MCRMSALVAATALSLTLAAPALAKPVKAKPVAPAEAEAGPRRGTLEERQLAVRLEPLARAAFWAREADLDPRDTEAGVRLAEALRSLGQFDDAIQAAQRVLVLNPASYDALMEVARSQVSKGQGFYAIDPARQALALSPRDWRAASLLGVAYEQADRDEEALAAHLQAQKLAPENPGVLTNLALFYAAHNDPARAETLLRKAAARPDATVAVRQNLALILGLQGRLDEAEKLARQDLPPEAVANNLAYLRAASSSGAGRNWDSLKTSQ